MHSLSHRLLLSLGLSLVLVFAVMAFLVSEQVGHLMERMVVSRIEHDSEELLAGMNINASDRIDITDDHIPSIYLRPFSGHYFVVRYGEQTIRSRSLWDEALPAQPPGVALNVAGPMQQRLLVWSADFHVHGHTVRLEIGENVTELHRMAEAFRWSLLMLSGLALLMLLALQFTVVRYSLRPLSRLREDIGHLERGEIEHLEQPGLQEIAPLVEGFNQLLQVLGQRLARSRQSLGNLAHALKTPLTRIMQLIERPTGTRDDRRQAVLEQLGFIQQRIDQELGRARMAGRGPGGAWPDPRHDLEDLAGGLQAIHDGRMHIDLRLLVSWVAADREDMLELIGNLLENACKWGKQQVNCTLHPEGKGLELVVEDDGPGMADEEAAQAFERGTRLDEQVPGHGLGLAIVHELVDSYGGGIELDRSPDLGGLRVRVTLPVRVTAD
jgi:signal transduction histidine kinase